MRPIVDRFPRAAWACAVVGVLNALAWGLITPPFHVPDEPQHVAYVQYLAETGRLPGAGPSRGEFSSEQLAAFDGADFEQVAGNRRGKPPWSESDRHALVGKLRQPLERDDGGGVTTAVTNPPFYYALEALPYWAASSGTFFDRLVVMRILSAMLGGITVLLCFAFARELLPRTPWVATSAGLAVALQPVFGFMGGGVNPDNLFFVVSAGVFLLIARAFRYGLTPRLSIALGVLLATGLLTKGTIVGFVPGALLGLGLLVWRSGVAERRATAKAALIAVAIAGGALIVYLVVSNTIWDRQLYEGAGSVATSVAGTRLNAREFISYAWQFYLPRLPFMTEHWPGAYPLYDVWLKSFIGNFGWLDYRFPSWVYPVGGGVFLAVVSVAIRGLYVARTALVTRWQEATTYVCITLGLLAVVAFSGYRYRIDTGYVFEQGRYLLPLLALYGGLIAVAMRGSGKYAPVVGSAIVVLTMAQGLFAQLLTLARYYG